MAREPELRSALRSSRADLPGIQKVTLTLHQT
jgi:hypothetical protein